MWVQISDQNLKMRKSVSFQHEMSQYAGFRDKNWKIIKWSGLSSVQKFIFWFVVFVYKFRLLIQAQQFKIYKARCFDIKSYIL